MTAPLRGCYRLSEAAFDRLLLAILILAAATVAAASAYHFRIVSARDTYDSRDKIKVPRLLNYLISTASGSLLLPFSFAGFVFRRRYNGAAAVLFTARTTSFRRARSRAPARFRCSSR